MLINKIIEKYKNIRKQTFLNQVEKYQYKYAFVGVGSHSIANLYPCIDYLRVPIKTIYSHTLENAAKMAARYPHARSTIQLLDIIQDKTIKGVFVCVKPEAQFKIVMQLLEAGKNVFVEKPCCTNISELNKLIQSCSNSICLVGLQRRYSLINQKLKKYLKSVKNFTYNYKYLTGSYPEGSLVLDIYIHGVDNLVYLFGPIRDAQILTTTQDKGVSSTFMLLTHTSNVVGVIELSTDYSWGESKEVLTINTKHEVYEVNYPNMLTGTRKRGSILNVPLEKIISGPVTQRILFHNNFIPVLENNNLVAQGYFQEISTFVNLVENRKGVNLSAPKDLLETYKLLEKIQNS